MSKMYLNGIVYGGAELPSSYACELLFENTDWSIAGGTGDVVQTYTLSKSIDNFDAVLVTGYMFNSSNENERNQIQTMYIVKKDYYARSKTGVVATAFALQGTVVGVRRRIYFGFNSDTTMTVIDTRSQSGEEPKIYRVYGIKFGGYATHDYSTEEHVVGKWIDGSTLYEKTLYYDNTDGITSTNQNDYEVATIPNIVIRNAGGSMINSTSGSSYALPYSVGSKGISITYLSGNVCIRNVGDTWNSNWKFYVTIRYTKTT